MSPLSKPNDAHGTETQPSFCRALAVLGRKSGPFYDCLISLHYNQSTTTDMSKDVIFSALSVAKTGEKHI